MTSADQRTTSTAAARSSLAVPDLGPGHDGSRSARVSSGGEAAAPPPAEVCETAEPGTILVVDDEEHLLEACARMLRLNRYKVLTAADGHAAIELVRAHHQELSLVLLDLTMPDLSGAQTFAAIREIAPELKVLLSSGYCVEGQAQELLNQGCNGFIQKPYECTTLLEKICAIS